MKINKENKEIKQQLLWFKNNIFIYYNYYNKFLIT